MKTVKVWDLYVRFFHWCLVVGIIAQLVTAEDLKNVHATVGYLLIVLLVLRILWGFVGSGHARFADFIYPPGEIFAYLKGLIRGNPRHYVGHNPAGGAMVCALLVILMLIALTGLKTLGAEGKGPLARQSQNLTARAWADDHTDRDDDDTARHDDAGENMNGAHSHGGNKAQAHFWKEIHETLVGIVLFLIALHICGVLASSYVHRENLILAMINGRKKTP
ncbi:MAG: cytochrome b/b6 domain-containing protein [Desulfobacteraceae bacterium]|jgi:cytochrome b